MAKIRIYRDERDGEAFPSVCMRCGAEVERMVPVRFAWMPGWAHLFIFIGALPWLLACLILRKSMRVTVPVCRDHANSWRNRRLFVFLGLAFWIAVGIALALLWDETPKEVAMPIGTFALFGSIFWLIAAAIYLNSGIKPARITDRYMDLVGASKEFASEWEGDEPLPSLRERAARKRAAERERDEE